MHVTETTPTKLNIFNTSCSPIDLLELPYLNELLNSISLFSEKGVKESINPEISKFSPESYGLQASTMATSDKKQGET